MNASDWEGHAVGRTRPVPLANDAPSAAPRGDESQFLLADFRNASKVSNCTVLVILPRPVTECCTISVANPMPIKSVAGKGPRGSRDGVLPISAQTQRRDRMVLKCPAIVLHDLPAIMSSETRRMFHIITSSLVSAGLPSRL